MKKANPNPSIIQIEQDVFPLDDKEIKKQLSKIKLKTKPSIIFFGSSSFVIPVLKVIDENFEVSAVITKKDSPIASVFRGLIYAPEKLDEDFLDQIKELKPDLFVVASYGKILPEELLNIPTCGALNVHPSLLPKYRGPSPITATILNEEKEAGVTIIQMDKEMDHGPIIAQQKYQLEGSETFDNLAEKLFTLGAQIIVEVIPEFIAGKIIPHPQKHSNATFCKLIKRDDGYFDINNPPERETLDRMVRAYHPWPGVWAKWNGKIVKFFPEGKIQMEGKKILSFKDFLNGYPDFPLTIN